MRPRGTVDRFLRADSVIRKGAMAASVWQRQSPSGNGKLVVAWKWQSPNNPWPFTYDTIAPPHGSFRKSEGLAGQALDPPLSDA